MTATSSNSSLTTTSHTMTACPLLSSSFPASGSTSAPTLCEILAPSNRHLFVTPTSAFSDISLGLAKTVLDKSAGALADAQLARLKENREKQKRKRHRNHIGNDENSQVLKIRKICTQGFDVQNVWEQAQRVIAALREDVERNLDQLDQKAASNSEETTLNLSQSPGSDSQPQVDSDDEVEVENESEYSMSDVSEENTSEKDDISTKIQEADEHEEKLTNLNDNKISKQTGQEDQEGDENSTEFYYADPHNLNDGFFSIDEFNRQTELLEREGPLANSFPEEDDDKEEIDWEANPLSEKFNLITSSKLSSSKNLKTKDDDGEEQLEEELEEELERDGPTFGNSDLNAPEWESDEEFNEEDSAPSKGNANDIMYSDFFKPAPRKADRSELQARYLERKENRSKHSDPADENTDLERTMANVRMDLFDDEPDDSFSDSNQSDAMTKKSTHERKQAKLMKEIRELEAAAVASREWTLAGEARATDRPLNSILEKDLDFEHTGKPVLEVTTEISESIEELIKRRILAQEFDEVIRRRPDDLTKTSVRRGIFELDDNKPKQSLADIYAEEHVKANNPNTYISTADEKIQEDQREIEALWKDISAKLDALSSWHFKPKPATPSLTVVSDVAAITMEDAQPAIASGIVGSESMLAPQEIYKSGKKKDALEKDDIVPSSGLPIARQEMTREQKIRRRRREKERISKRGGLERSQASESRKVKETKETLKDLKRGGVKIIGKKGDVRDVEGNKILTKSSSSDASKFKL